MKFFRIQTTNGASSTLKTIVWAWIAAAVVVSFFIQMSLGICPVP